MRWRGALAFFIEGQLVRLTLWKEEPSSIGSHQTLTACTSGAARVAGTFGYLSVRFGP
jgi:hypothetical protein